MITGSNSSDGTSSGIIAAVVVVVIIVIVLMIVTILLVMLWSVLEDLSLTSTPLSPSLTLSLTRLKWRRRTRATPYTKDDLLGEPDDSLQSQHTTLHLIT